MAKFIHDGASIDYRPTSAVDAGDVVVLGDLVCVAKRAIAANELGALATEGVFAFPKDTDSTDALSAGTKVYWDTINEIVSTSADDGKYIGKVVKDAGADDTVV
ncbi:MAG: DUF2190 family protein, partial [Candidatus Thermoplasmatota archaeon]|nr:DUF2190 family protein [Candidatus Thermoplasmatota archaeon]